MELICLALSIWVLLLFIRIIMSWVTMLWSPPGAASPAVRVLYDLTEPVLSVVRRYMPAVGGFDFSPIVVFLIVGAILRSIGCR
jgi:YggT family protein